MSNGDVSTVITKELTEVPVENGEYKVVERRTTQKTFKKPLPKWVADRILGKNLPLIEAVQMLVMNGVATPTQAAIVESCLADMERQLKESAQMSAIANNLETLLPPSA